MKRDPSGYWNSLGVKGDLPGHPFRGNQYREGGGSGGFIIANEAALKDEHYKDLTYGEDQRTNVSEKKMALHDDARLKAATFAREHAGEMNEVGFAVMGNRVKQFGGSGLTINVGDSKIEHFVHTHPSGASFSAGDLGAFFGHKETMSVEAISPNGTIYRLEKKRPMGSAQIGMVMNIMFTTKFQDMMSRHTRESLVGPDWDNPKATALFVKECDRIMREIADQFSNDISYTISKPELKGGKKKSAQPGKESIEEYAARIKPDTTGFDPNVIDDLQIVDPYKWLAKRGAK